MKKFIFAIALGITLAAFTTSCDDNGGAIWDIAPVKAIIKITDAKGTDLLSPNTEGNLVGQSATLVYNGDTTNYVLTPTYPDLGDPAKMSRAYLAQFTGIEVIQMYYEKCWALYIGEWPGENSGTYDMELIIAGQSHSIKITNVFKWKHNAPDVKREHFLDGQPVDRIMTLVL